MGEPALEDGWALLADGLHLHRFYLEVQPFRELREQDRYDTLRRRHPGRCIPPLQTLRMRFGEAFLEHLLHPAQPPDWLNRMRELSAPATVPLCGTAVAFVNQRSCLVSDAADVLLADKFGTEPDIRPATVDEAARLIDAADLGYLVASCAQMIVHVSHDVPVPNPFAMDGPLGTVQVQPVMPVWRYAQRVITAAAAQLLATFAVVGNTPPANGRQWSTPDGYPDGRDELATWLLQLGLATRFLTRVLDAALLGPPDAGRARRHLRRLRGELDLVGDIARDVASAYEESNTYDLIVTNVPGPGQFHAYREGGGAGQH